MRKPRYNRQGWPLTLCGECAAPRYCEPHGTTAECTCAAERTESVSIPFRYGDAVIVLTAAHRLSLVDGLRR